MKILIFILTLTGSSMVWAECVSGNCENGTGTFAGPDGFKYVGDWRDGKYHGDGTYFWPGGNYIGEFVDGKFHGKGTETWKFFRTKYVGEWRDSNKHGKGTQTYADGTVKAGAWEDDKYFGTEAEWDVKLEKERLAKEKHDRIYRACLLDKGANHDMQVPELKQAVVKTCEAVAADPSWLDEWRYD